MFQRLHAHLPQRCTRLRLRLRNDDTAAELVEFALASSILFMLVFGIMDCSRAVYFDHYVASAAQDATRYAMTRGASQTSPCTTIHTTNCNATASNIAAYVTGTTPSGFTPAALSVTTTWPGTNPAGTVGKCSKTPNSAGCLVRVRVAYTFKMTLPFLPQNTISLASTSAVAIAQ